MGAQTNIEIDYLIVGQGLAGTILAQTLLWQGKRVKIIDDAPASQASKVAAGLYNPVVFKRLVKSWRADELIPVMDEFYKRCEKELNQVFYHKKQIVKLFAEENEKAFWLKKSNEDVGRYLNKTLNDTFLPALVEAPFGSAEVTDAGNLDTVMFLNTYRAYFNEQNLLMEEKLDYAAVQPEEAGAVYKHIRAKKIIFCEGYKAMNNPYFSLLPFKLTKGEVLTIQLLNGNEIPTEKVINKGVFILPFGNNIYKVGATYEWSDLTEQITEKGKTDLLEKLRKIIKVPFEVIDHQAGIRPTVSDRRPLIGFHPQHSSLAVFNGMGTKGVMLTPYFAAHFADVLSEKATLDQEVNISRFK